MYVCIVNELTFLYFQWLACCFIFSYMSISRYIIAWRIVMN